MGGEPSPRGYEALRSTLAANPRAATPLEIANLILFLLSSDASFVNDAAIIADAGWNAA